MSVETPIVKTYCRGSLRLPVQGQSSRSVCDKDLSATRVNQRRKPNCGMRLGSHSHLGMIHPPMWEELPLVGMLESIETFAVTERLD